MRGGAPDPFVYRPLFMVDGLCVLYSVIVRFSSEAFLVGHPV